MYHLAVCVFEHHLWDFGCVLQRVCTCVCSFVEYPVFLPCLWILRLARLMYVAGGSSKAKAESSQKLQRRQERERQVDGFRVNSDSEALPQECAPQFGFEAKVDRRSESVRDAGQRRFKPCSRVQGGTQKFCRKVGQPASHDVLCGFNNDFYMIGSSNSVSSSEESVDKTGLGLELKRVCRRLCRQCRCMANACRN